MYKLHSLSLNYAGNAAYTKSALYHDGGQATALVDGNLQTSSQSNVAHNPWLKVDLGTVYLIEGVALHNAEDKPGNQRNLSECSGESWNQLWCICTGTLTI